MAVATLRGLKAIIAYVSSMKKKEKKIRDALPTLAFSDVVSPLFIVYSANICSLRGCVKRPSAMALSHGLDDAL
jgi:hypothetical protein